MHFCSMLMYLVAFTVPSTMCRRPTPLAAMQPQIFRACYTASLSGSSTPVWTLHQESSHTCWPVCQTGRECFHRWTGPSPSSRNSSWRTASWRTGFSCASRHQSSVTSCVHVPCSPFDQTAGIGNAVLMSCRQPCTSPTTHAIVEATSTCGWPKRCGEVCGPCVKLACVDNQVELCPLLTPSLDSSIGFGQPCSDYSRFLRL